MIRLLSSPTINFTNNHCEQFHALSHPSAAPVHRGYPRWCPFGFQAGSRSRQQPGFHLGGLPDVRLGDVPPQGLLPPAL